MVCGSDPAGAATTSTQLDAAHTGVSATPFAPPLRERWRRTFNAGAPGQHEVRFPLTGGGRVYVTHQVPGEPGRVVALSPATGATLWSRPITGHIQGAAIGSGKIIVSTLNALLSFDADTGAPGWSRSTWPGRDGSGLFRGAVVSGGIAYVGVSGYGHGLYALDALTGDVKWWHESAAPPGVAVDGERIYSNDGRTLVARNRTTGVTAWSVPVEASSGMESEPAVAGGRVYVGGAPNGPVFNATTGTRLRSHWSGGLPAVEADRAYLLSSEPHAQGDVLEAVDAVTGARQWEFGGWNGLMSFPLVAGGVVYALGWDALFALDKTTGKPVWCSRTGTSGGGGRQQGLALGEGLLLLPVGGELVAMEPGGTPGCKFHETVLRGYTDPIDGVPTARAASARRGTLGHPGGFARDLRAPGTAERWIARSRDHALLVDASGPTLSLPARGALPGAGTTVSVRMRGARRARRVLTGRALPGVVNDFRGSNPARWRTGAKRFGRLRLPDLRPGIDMVVRQGSADRFEYDLIVAPGADPRGVVLDFRGTSRPSIDRDGSLLLRTAAGTLRQPAPIAYQREGARKVRVPARFALTRDGGVRFDVDRYDRRRTLVIDPVLEWGTYLGGGLDDSALAVASDPTGNVYVAGTTISRDLPGGGAFDGWDERNAICGEIDRCTDAFVAKYAPSGALVHLSYLSGRDHDVARGVAADAAGNAYVTGNTMSPNFPTRSAVQSSWNCGGAYGDAFVAKLGPDGRTLGYSTYLGGCASLGDVGRGIAVDGQGRAVVTGWTDAYDFPTTAGAADRRCGAPATESGGRCSEGFVARLSASGAALDWSTYFGGDRSVEEPNDVALDGQGRPVLTGDVASWGSKDFPATAGSYDADPAPSFTEVFAARLAADGSALQWATAFGGEDWDEGDELALDGAGDVHIAGTTESRTFPTTDGAMDRLCNDDPSEYSCTNNADAFALELSADGSRLLASTYLGGSGDETGLGIALDGSGRAYVAGGSPYAAGGFPLVDAFQRESKHNHTWCGARSDCSDAFIVRLDAAKSRAEYGTLHGGLSDDYATGVALAGGDAYIAGVTHSPDLATTAGAPQPRWAGGNCDFLRSSLDFPSCSDAFVARVDEAKPPPPTGGGDPDADPGTTDPDPDPGTKDPGTGDSGTTDPGTTDPGTTGTGAGTGNGTAGAGTSPSTGIGGSSPGTSVPAPRAGSATPRTVSLTRRGRTLSGRLRATASSCTAVATVVLERRSGRAWRRVRSTRSDRLGRFRLTLPAGAKGLRLRVPASTRSAQVRCAALVRRV